MLENPYYTGVGSRTTPSDILVKMTALAGQLEDLGHILRSGAAPGADHAFERGVKDPGHAHIYLPWRGFAEHPSTKFRTFDAAFAMAARVHPRWGTLKRAARSLHARNVHQVLGDNLTSPSKFLVCWTTNGQDVGGTRTAIVVAKMHSIPVFNLFKTDVQAVLEFAKKAS